MFRSLRQAAAVRKRRLGQRLLRSPLHPLYLKLAGSPQVREYRRYLASLGEDNPPSEWFTQQVARWDYRPTVSILMAVHNSKPAWLEQAIRSVMDQVYPHWQLCICDDASDTAGLPSGLDDSRIQFTASATRLGISGALNRALELATGDYIGVLDHDDFLSTEALFRVAEALQRERYGVLYSDEDYVNEAGEPIRPNLKPDWSPELLSNCMYIGHLAVASKDLLSAAGGFRTEFDGAQDYDLALRLTDHPVAVAHLPHILYHWRQHSESIAHHPAAKPWANDAGHRAAEDTIRRRHWKAAVHNDDNPTRYHIVWDVPAEENVSVILTPKSDDELERCLKSLALPQGVEILAIRAEEADTAAARMNLGAAKSKAAYLIFLDCNVTPIEANWLWVLLSTARRSEVGAVGAKLLYPDGSLLHSGIALLDGAIAYPGRKLYQSDYWRWVDYTRNVTAVSGACMAIRRDAFHAVGGFNAAFSPENAAVDLCLKLQADGYEVILEQGASLIQEEPRPREPRALALEKPDPYYNPHLTTAREDLSLADPGKAIC